MEAMLSGRVRRQRQRHGLGQPRHRRDRAAGIVQDLLHQSQQRQVRARRIHRRQGQPVQDDRRPQGQADRLRSRHPERDACQDDARARRRHRHDGHRAADRPARRVDRRGTGRCLLHARADRHDRTHERHDARAGGGRGREVHPGRSAWRRGTADRRASPSEFIKKNPDAAKKYMAAYLQGRRTRAHQAGRGAPVS